jgi:GDP-D-mannose 3',5'-epimerase
MVTYLVAGAGGFIGGHLVKSLINDGFAVRAIDIKPLDAWYQLDANATNIQDDLSLLDACENAVQGVDRAINLAADMGGMGFIETHKAECMLSVLINTHLLSASRKSNVYKYLFASSACVYNSEKQNDPDVTALRESDAYPADPEDGYGWEKLFSERMCRHFFEDFRLHTYAPRFHNVYGPHGTFDGGREKAPAAIARKVALAKLSGTKSIEIWGDGKQTRSFMYIDDCVRGVRDLIDSDVHEPINLGSAELVSINELVDVTEEIAGVRLERTYILDAPQGVRGRNSDNTRFREAFGWEPSISLRTGMEATFAWIYDQLSK